MPRRFHSLRVNPWHISIFREQGWRSGENARPSMFPGFDYGPVPYAGEFVVGSHLAPRVFSGFSSFPSSTKTSISKFQFDQDRGPAWKPARVGVASSLNIRSRNRNFDCLRGCLILKRSTKSKLRRTERSLWRTGPKCKVTSLNEGAWLKWLR